MILAWPHILSSRENNLHICISVYAHTMAEGVGYASSTIIPRSVSSMRAVSADPRTHRLMMHAQLASDAPVTHALFCKRQSLRFSLLIGLPDTWLRSEVQLTRTAAKSLTPRSIFPAFDDLSHLVTLRAYGKNASPRARHRCTPFH